MIKYKQIYCDHFGYSTADTILCEVCGGVANSIHHVIYRSHFGKKKKGECDAITNLIALCQNCHDKVHCRDSSIKVKIKEVMEKRIYA